MANKVFLLGLLACILQGTDAVLKFNATQTGSLTNTLKSLREDTPTGSFLGMISCYDEDTVSGTKDSDGISLSLSRLGNVIGLFRPNAASSGVTLKQAQDYELAGNQNNRDVQFLCSKTGFDSLKFSTNLFIEDVNDNEPVFKRAGGSDDIYNVEIPEVMNDVPAGGKMVFDQMIVEDVDGVNNNDVVALCVNITTIPRNMGITCGDVFRVEAEKTNELKPTRYKFKLFALRGNYEQFQSLTLSVLAMNTPSNTRTNPVLNSTSQNVLVTIREIQNEAPIIEQNTLRITMKENAIIGFPVSFSHYIEAHDEDLRDPNPIEFELFRSNLEQDGFDFFDLGVTLPPVDNTKRNYQTQLYVKSNVDREAIVDSAKNLYVNIRAYETNPNNEPDRNPMNSTAVITVHVVDVNDEEPTFESNSYVAAVNEQVGIPTNGTTQIVPAGNPIIVTDKDGVLYNVYNVTILPGTYANSFQLDKNEGRAKTFFTLSVNNDVLDYERGVDTMSIVLQAQDVNNTQFTSTARVTVTINPLNDFRPKFLQDVYNFNVSETKPENEPINELIGSVQATDGDRGQQGEIQGYSITDPANMFTITSSGQIYLIAPVDYETVRSFAFSVTTQDNDPENPRVASVQVNVQVQNIIDAPPVITDTYTANVFESSTDLRPEIRVKAVNIEELTTITFNLVGVQPPTINVNEYFSINPITGELRMLRTLNFMNTNKGLIRVLVRASATPALYSEKYVNITVVNENNYPPVFQPVVADGIYYASVSELAAPGEVVIKLNTTDDDEEDTPASTVRYQIQSGGDNDFIIQENSGTIIVSNENSLDANDQSQYRIVVKAIDSGSPIMSSNATVIVTIENKNNKAPEFGRPLYQFRVNESASVNTEVGRVSATDPDLTPNIVYGLDFANTRIEKNNRQVPDFVNLANILKMERVSGIIRVSGALNRQIYDRILINATAQDLNAEDGSPTQISSASVVINILAIADPTILFELPWTKQRPIIDVRISENDNNTGEPIHKLQATDPSASKRISTFRKVISSDPGDYFQVVEKSSGTNEATGNIKLKKPLDYEMLPFNGNNQKIVSVVVQAISEDELRTSTATVNFQITDVNDNEPVFVPGTYIKKLNENSAYPTQVTLISVTDKDSSSYGLVQFSLEGDDSVKDFFIANIEGQANVAGVYVALNATLDYETNPTYNILVIATDNNGSPDGNRVSQNLRIDLDDVNDNPPIFEDDVYRFSTIGTAEDNAAVGQVLADDLDRGDGGKIRYSLINKGSYSGPTYFKIDDDQGSTDNVGNILQIGTITVALSLEDLPDREIFELIAVATDKGVPPLSSSATVFITVTRGVQDPKPKWNSLLPTKVTIPENRPADFYVATVQATPGTTGNRTAIILYSFVTAADALDESSKFYIDQITGVVRTKQPLDYEEDKFYSANGQVYATYKLLILATDSTNSTLTNQLLLTVELLDEDDNDPTFQNCTDRTYSIPVYARVMEARPANQFVYKVESCDDDEAPHNDVAYQPYSPPTTEQFRSLCPDQGAFDTVFNLDSITGIISTMVVLDREAVNTYLLCVQTIKQSSLRKKRGVLDRPLAKTLHDVLFIRVTIDDANDNGPQFTESIVKKVILTYPSLDISVAEATDPDLPPNNGIRYSIEQIEFYKSNRKYRAPAAFTIDANDGNIYASQSSYQEYDGGYFRIIVKAEDYNGDNDLTDTQIQMVYVAQPSNRIRVVIDKPADSDVADDIYAMIGKLNGLQDGIFYEVDKISYHVEGSQENLVSDRTDVCILVVRDNSVQTARDATVFLEQQASVVDILDDYGAREPGPCEPAKSVYPKGWDSYWWVLVAFAIFIFLCVLILIFIILSLYSGYKRYMETRRTYLVPQ